MHIYMCNPVIIIVIVPGNKKINNPIIRYPISALEL